MKLIAKKYAKALYSLAGKNAEGGDEFHPGLSAAGELFGQADARKILKSPIMPAELKRELLIYALSTAGENRELIAFVDLLISAKRVELLPEIIVAYEELLTAARGIQPGVLSSAVALQKGEITAIEQELTGIFNKQVVLENRVAADLLGGFVIRVGNSIIDQSITSKIKALAQGVQHS
jgi:F-type H+-transporting ATPase subunit delta